MADFELRNYLTPYKSQKAVVGPSGAADSFDSMAVDCPFSFYHNGKHHIMHVGFNGKGYQTCIASGDSPMGPFTEQNIVLKAGEGNGWDTLNAAGTWLLSEDSLFNTRRLKKHDGKYWMLYHSYPGEGYESGAGSIGLAYTENEDLRQWTRLEKPVLMAKDGAPWEVGGLYKGCLMERNGLFYIYYNAKDHTTGPWKEQTGVATSRDLRTWERYEGNPVLRVSPGRWDEKFTSDPWVVWDDRHKLWVMFFFGYNGKHAQDGIAYSEDMFRWHKHPEPILESGTGDEIDTIHAHKPSIYYFDGTLYHYYCACRPRRDGDTVFDKYSHFRCISVACDKPFA